MKIRKSTEPEKKEILSVHEKAFGKEKGPEIGQLVNDLFADQTAEPVLSLVAVEKDKIVGHVLFTKVTIDGCSGSLQAQILAPLAILPENQNMGVGEKLINKGLEVLKNDNVKLVFVLGHPAYYPRCGFKTAGVLGFEAPYPIPDEVSDAWMVQELFPGIIGTMKGKVKCSDVLDKPEHWRE